jgi:two-component system response regulator YesN
MYHLLIVDDEPKVRWRVQHMVDGFDLGWDCTSAGDGAEALEILEGGGMDLVVTDIRMPTMDGLVFLEELRGRGSSTLVVILSAHMDFAYARQAMRLGALDYLVKPIDSSDLRNVLLRVAQVQALEAPGGNGRSQQEANGDLLRVRLLTELLEGRLPPHDWHARAQALGMDAVAGRVASFSYEATAHDAVDLWLEELHRLVTREQALQVIVWDRTHISVVLLSRNSGGLHGVGPAAPTPTPVDQSLAACSIPDVQVGVGTVNVIDQIRYSYLESLRDLYEHTLPGGRPQGSHALRPVGVVSASAQHAVEQACAWLTTHYAHTVTLGDIARAVHFHPKYLCAIFPSVTGHSFTEYLAAIRIERAKSLLTESRMPCHAIAESVGYQNERCLAQAFRRLVGITPTEYRQAHGLQMELLVADGMQNDTV